MDEVKVNELIKKALEDTVWSAFSQSAIERVAKKKFYESPLYSCRGACVFWGGPVT